MINNNDYPWYKYYKGMKKKLKVDDVSMYEMVKRCANKFPFLTAYSYFLRTLPFWYTNHMCKCICRIRS